MMFCDIPLTHRLLYIEFKYILIVQDLDFQIKNCQYFNLNLLFSLYSLMVFTDIALTHDLL